MSALPHPLSEDVKDNRASGRVGGVLIEDMREPFRTAFGRHREVAALACPDHEHRVGCFIHIPHFDAVVEMSGWGADGRDVFRCPEGHEVTLSSLVPIPANNLR